MLKCDLQDSTNDLLESVKSFERTVSNQHRRIHQQIADDLVRRPLRFLTPLLRDVVNKISSHALYKVLEIHDRYLPVGSGKTQINPECSGVTKQTMGLPCIHISLKCVDIGRSLSIHEFHARWRIYETDENHPVDPRLFVLEPNIVQTRGRPAGSINQPTASQIITSQQATQQDASTRREPSAFEYVLAQEDLGRGECGRGYGNEGQYGRQCGGKDAGIPGHMTGVIEF